MIRRSFAEATQKALRSMETGLAGFDEIPLANAVAARVALAQPTPDRLLAIAQAFRLGLGVEEIAGVCRYDHWFLREIVAKGKVLYEKNDGRVGAKGRGRLPARKKNRPRKRPLS